MLKELEEAGCTQEELQGFHKALGTDKSFLCMPNHESAGVDDALIHLMEPVPSQAIFKLENKWSLSTLPEENRNDVLNQVLDSIMMVKELVNPTEAEQLEHAMGKVSQALDALACIA